MAVAVLEREPPDDIEIGPKVVVTAEEYRELKVVAPDLARAVEALGETAVLQDYDDGLAEQAVPVGAAYVEDSPGFDLFTLYKEQIGQYPLIDKQREIELAQEMEAGKAAAQELQVTSTKLTPTQKRKLQTTAKEGERAKREFTNANLRLVVSIALKYKRSRLPILDRVQEGNLGLMRAVEKFDWRKGFKFSTYATWWIREAIEGANAQKPKIIHVSEKQQKQLIGLRKIEECLLATMRRPPTTEELAAEAGMSVKEVQRLQALDDVEPLSLDQSEDTRYENTSISHDRVADPDSSNGYDRVQEISNTANFVVALEDLLDSRESQALLVSSGFSTGTPQSHDEIASAMGINRVRVGQIKAEAKAKILHPSTHATVSRYAHERLTSEDLEWKAQALCADLPANALAATPSKDASYKRLKQLQTDVVEHLCPSCPAKDQCAQLASELKPRGGVWGGQIFRGSKSIPTKAS